MKGVPLKKRVNISLDKEVVEMVKEMCSHRHTTISQYFSDKIVFDYENSKNFGLVNQEGIKIR